MRTKTCIYLDSWCQVFCLRHPVFPVAGFSLVVHDRQYVNSVGITTVQKPERKMFNLTTTNSTCYNWPDFRVACYPLAGLSNFS